LNAWGSVIGLSLVQDIFLVGITKVYILQWLPAQLMQPQLTRIRMVLADLSMNYLNRYNSFEEETGGGSTGMYIYTYKYIYIYVYVYV
jgi:hypothetical protein